MNQFIKVVLVFCLALPVLAQDAPNDVAVNYDRFKDETTILTHMTFFGGNIFNGIQRLTLAFGYQFAGKELKKSADKILIMALIRTPDKGKETELIFLANETERIRVEKLTLVSSEQDTDGKYNDQQYMGFLTYPNFMKLAFASKVEFRIGSIEQPVRQEQMQQLRRFDAKVTSPKEPHK